MKEYNERVDQIMKSGAENIMNWLQTYDEKYLTASKAAQEEYIRSWKETINEAESYLNNVVGSTVVPSKDKVALAQKEIAAAAQVVYQKIRDAGYTTGAAHIESHNEEGAFKWYNDFIQDRTDIDPKTKELFWEIVKLKFQWAGKPLPGYSQGGLADYTGLAMVHGSTSRPEAFLDANDTANFQVLKELLSKAFSYRGGAQSDLPSAVQIGECQIVVEVGDIADDYSVDEAVQKVKQSIIDSANYRNVNIVTRRK